jgi:PST family polysaccharide transporter
MSRLVVQVASVAVLARLLSPTDYGLVAIGLAVVGLGEVFRDFGLSTAAVQAPQLSAVQRDKLFWLNVGIGLLLSMATFGVAPLLGELFSQPQLPPVIQGLALFFLINGATAQYRASLNREMRFGALVACELGGQVAGTVCAVALALAGWGVWALVGQQLAAASVTLVWCAALARWLPRGWKREPSVRPMVRFGAGMVGTQLLGYAGSNADTLIIGLRLAPAELGFYNRGYQLLMRPLGQVRNPTTTVAVPTLGRLRDDPAKADQFIVTGQLALGYTLVLGTAWAAGASAPMVAVFLGDGWDPVAPVFALLAVAGIFQTLSFVGYWVYVSRGLTGQLFRYSIVSLVLRVLGIAIGSVWGIVGVAAGIAVASLVSWPASLWWLSRLTRLPLRQLVLGAARVAVVSAAVLIASLVTATNAGVNSALAALLLTLAAAASTVAICVLAVPVVRRDVLSLWAVARRARLAP